MSMREVSLDLFFIMSLCTSNDCIWSNRVHFHVFTIPMFIKTTLKFKDLGLVARKRTFVVYEQQKHRPACAFAQSGQRL